jgi:hypothetical protein
VFPVFLFLLVVYFSEFKFKIYKLQIFILFQSIIIKNKHLTGEFKGTFKFTNQNSEILALRKVFKSVQNPVNIWLLVVL